MGLQPGARLGHYDVVAPLGAGGMGEVYRATDTKLGREVALKVLPADMAADPQRLDRFRREARTVAGLNHPHIVTVYSVEEADGIHFLTMELVEGQTLEQRISDKGMTPSDLLAVAVPLAEALTAAHEKGVVHRDLKPGNVMVTADGRVKVLDFGLAKVAETGLGSHDVTMTRALTREGVVMGTFPYMSPEQVAGRSVDARSDIFSLGIVLYELATGERPFRGSSSAELVSAILRDQPAPVHEVRSDLPPQLGRIVRRCLAKDPNDRFQTARDVFTELRELQRETSGPATASGERRPASTASTGSTGEGDGFWIAVLPFKCTATSPELSELAEGLTEEIVSGLLRFSYLRVIARGSTLRPARSASGFQTVGSETGARYVMEGSVRKSGSQVRVSVQLVDASTGAHLWAETYNRVFAPDRIFDLQDDLVARIVSTCADHFGVLARAISEVVRRKPAADLTPYEALMRGFGYHFRLSPEEHAEARDVLERAVEQAPANPDCWAMLSWVYSHERAHGFNPRPASLDRALDAARRAVDLAPSNHLAYQALAVALFFRKERAECLSAAERAMALNPLDGSNEAFFLVTLTGDWERGTSLIRRAMELNPHHPRWYELILGFNEYRLGRYREAVEEIRRANLGEGLWTSALLAAAHAQLGDRAAADDAVRGLLALGGDVARSAREHFEKWFEPQLVEHLMDGLRRAGVSGGPEARTKDAPKVTGTTATAGPSIAVLPFASLSADREQEYFSDGLAEEVITILSQVAGLKVIARTSSFAFRGKDDDIRRIAAALDVTHVLEGSVRRAGTRIRVTTQLVAAADGRQVWSERYDRELSDVFAMQDEMAGAITAALKVRLGVAPASARQYVPKVEAYESYLSGRAHLGQFTPEAWIRAKADFDRAIRADPSYAKPHAELALGYFIRGMHGMQPMREVAPFVRAEVTRALELDPTDPQPRFVLGAITLVHDYQWEEAAAHFAASMSGPYVPAHARWIYASLYLAALGRFEDSAAEMARAAEQDPLNPTWHAIWALHLLRLRPEEAMEIARRSVGIDSTYFLTHHSVGEAAWAAGRRDEAIAAWERAHPLAPWFTVTTGWLAAAHRLAGRNDKADALLAAMGPTARPFWGRVQYHLLVSELDAAADWYERMIEERDPFALLYASSDCTASLRVHPRWARIARLLNLPVSAS